LPTSSEWMLAVLAALMLLVAIPRQRPLDI
jgi:hypothetical protein